MGKQLGWGDGGGARLATGPGLPPAPHCPQVEKRSEASVPPVSLVIVVESLGLCPSLCDPMDGSPPGFSVHGISQARILEWVAI